MKAMVLSVNALVVIVVVVIVVLALGGTFLGVWGASSPGISVEAAKNSACQMLLFRNCEDPTVIKTPGFDSDMNGAIDDDDDLQDLCDNYYGADGDVAACKKICGCGGILGGEEN